MYSQYMLLFINECDQIQNVNFQTHLSYCSQFSELRCFSFIFYSVITLTHTAFSIQIASPGSKVVEFVNQDDHSRRWINDFRAKPFSNPVSLEMVDPNHYTALLIPHSAGALRDLAHNKDLAIILNQFLKDKKPICALGLGVGALFCAVQDDRVLWSFKKYSLTASSLYELVRSPDFPAQPIIPEDFIKENCATYSASEPDAVHVIIDRHVITGQNEQSTLTAVQISFYYATRSKEKLCGSDI